MSIDEDLDEVFMKRNWRQLVLLALAIILIIFLVLDLAPTEGTPTIVAALIAAAVALTINETVSERQEREVKAQAEERRNRSEQHEREAKALREEREAEAKRHEREFQSQLRTQREDAYHEVLEHLFYSFSGLPPEKSEFYIRNKIVMWGSSDFLEAYMEWRQAIAELSGRGLVKIPIAKKPNIERALARVAIAARHDLGVSSRHEPDVDYVIDVLFDHAGPGDSDFSQGRSGVASSGGVARQ